MGPFKLWPGPSPRSAPVGPRHLHLQSEPDLDQNSAVVISPNTSSVCYTSWPQLCALCYTSWPQLCVLSTADDVRHCPLWEIWVTSSEAGTKTALPIPINVCSTFLCPIVVWLPVQYFFVPCRKFTSPHLRPSKAQHHHKGSATHSCQCVKHFHASRHWSVSVWSTFMRPDTGLSVCEALSCVQTLVCQCVKHFHASRHWSVSVWSTFMRPDTGTAASLVPLCPLREIWLALPGYSTVPQGQRYPFLSVCEALSCVQTLVWPPV